MFVQDADVSFTKKQQNHTKTTLQNTNVEATSHGTGGGWAGSCGRPDLSEQGSGSQGEAQARGLTLGSVPTNQVWPLTPEPRSDDGEKQEGRMGQHSHTRQEGD